jgi:hypothetical protein
MIQSLPTSRYLERANEHRQLVFSQIKYLIIILYNTVDIMSQDAQSVQGGKARWTEQEIDALVDFLVEHHAERGDGTNFKDVTLNAAAAHLRPLLVSGKLKDGKSIKYKWGQVSSLDF